MLHEERVERDPVPRIDARPQACFGLGRGARSDDAQAVRDAVHMRVDRDRRDRIAEHEDAVRRLRPDARQRGQLVERSRHVPSEPVEERSGARADRPRLDPVEPGRADQALDRPGIGPGERRGVRIATEELRARDVRVRVPGPLGQDRAHQDLEGVLRVVAEVRGAPVSRPIQLGEPVEDGLPELGAQRRRGAHRTDPAPTRSVSLGARRASDGRRVPRPGSERSGSSEARPPLSSSPTR